MRILFLGGTGLTGPHAVRRLHELGHEVRVFHRGGGAPGVPSGVRRITGDFANPPDELLTPSPDVVVHMWLMTEAQARSFCRRFAGATGRAVAISSCDAYRNYGGLQRLESAPPDAAPLTEDSPLRESRYPYRTMKTSLLDIPEEYDKVLVESALREEASFPVTILRYPAVYGPHDYHRFGPWLARMAADDTELKIDENFAPWRWTHGFSEDVAEAIVLAATNEQAAGRTYNVGEPAAPTWAERLEEWGRVAGWGGRIVPVPPSELPEAMRTHHDFRYSLAIDTSRIRSELGYREVVAPAEGIARTIEWERSAK